MFFKRLIPLSLALTVALSQVIPTKVFVRDDSGAQPINPSLDEVQQSRRALNARAAEPMTNALRLARGLPPLPPVRRGEKGGNGRNGGGRPAPHPQPSQQPGRHVKRGYLMAFDEHNNLQGYISSTANAYQEYQLTSDVTEALEVEINSQASVTSLTADNSPFSKYSLVGGIKGYYSSSADISHGSSNYVYLGGVASSPKGSGPANAGNSFSDWAGVTEPSESVIWTYHDDQNESVTVQWINSDSSQPHTHLVYVQNTLCLTGDVKAFKKVYGGTKITFQFVSA